MAKPWVSRSPPVADWDAGEPGETSDPVHLETLAPPQHHTVVGDIDTQVGDLVLDHERGSWLHCETREFVGADGDLGECCR